jgi:hypothetical protein
MKDAVLGFCALLALCGSVFAAPTPAQPDIVLILAGDMGVSDLGC